HLGQKRRAREAVAMPARERAAKLGHQVADLEHRGTKRLDAFDSSEIEIHPAVDAALTEVTVVGRRLEIMPGKQPHETAQIVAQTRRRHGRVFGARPGARMAGDESAGAETRLAQAPNRPLFRGVK